VILRDITERAKAEQEIAARDEPASSRRPAQSASGARIARELHDGKPGPPR
jgi:hypothetical protein